MPANPPSWDERTDGSMFVSHWAMKDADVAKLAAVRDLTLWNVKFPGGFRFTDLAELEWLDIRGGSRGELSYLEGHRTLQGLSVSHVRGLDDLSTLSGLLGLRILALYALAKVERLPDLTSLVRLERLELGQLRRLTGWSALTTPPQLRELVFHNLLHPDLSVIEKLASHPTLRAFSWWAPDVPQGIQAAVHERLALPEARLLRPEKWLREARDT